MAILGSRNAWMTILPRPPRRRPNPGEWTPGPGSAKPIACDGPQGRPRPAGREPDNRQRGRRDAPDLPDEQSDRCCLIAGRRGRAGRAYQGRARRGERRTRRRRRRLDLDMAEFGNAVRMLLLLRRTPQRARDRPWAPWPRQPQSPARQSRGRRYCWVARRPCNRLQVQPAVLVITNRAREDWLG